MGKRYRCTGNPRGGTHFIPGKIYEVRSDGRIMGEYCLFGGWPGCDVIHWLTNEHHWYTFEEVTDMFNKDDLKTGMIAQTRNGAYWLVLRDTGCANCNEDGMVQIGDPHKDSCIKLSRFDETLGYIGSSNEYDIMKVVAPMNYPYVNNPAKDMENGKLLFDRSKIEERKKLTVEEIERLLGYKVAIVDEEEK